MLRRVIGTYFAAMQRWLLSQFTVIVLLRRVQTISFRVQYHHESDQIRSAKSAASQIK